MRKSRHYLLPLFLVLMTGILLVAARIRILERPEKRFLVTVIVDNSNSDRWIAMKEGLEQAAGDYNIELNIVSAGRFTDAEEELALLQRELGNDVDGIIMQMVSSEGVYNEMQELLSKEAVVLIGTNILPQESYPCVCADHLGMGEALADSVIEDYGSGLTGMTIGILCGNQKQLSMQQRLQGFKEKIEGTAAAVSWTLEAEDDLSETPFVDILVSLENDETERAVDYLQERRELLDKCMLYGAGISEKAVYYLDKGVIRTLVVPNEFNMGYQSVRTAAMQLEEAREGTGAKDVRVDHLVIDKSNLYDADNQKILFPVVQ